MRCALVGRVVSDCRDVRATALGCTAIGRAGTSMARSDHGGSNPVSGDDGAGLGCGRGRGCGAALRAGVVGRS